MVECYKYKNPATAIELHYWFNDGSHTMNAMQFNKCEHEFLGIVNEITSKLKLDVEVVVEPIGEGGIRSWFKFVGNHKDELKIQFVIYLCTSVMLTPLTTALSTLTEKGIEYIFEDSKIRELKKEKEIAELERDIEKARQETKKYSQDIDENVIRKKKSNFYETVSKTTKIDKISCSSLDSQRNVIYSDDVERASFCNYVLASDDVEPEEIEDATIEIISPVLKKGRYKWTGIYKDDVIHFYMKSQDFKNMVQQGKVVFKNGTTILCTLEIKKKMNAEGQVYVSGCDVVFVDSFFDNEHPVETNEGKKKRAKQDAEAMQLNLFSDKDF